MSDNSDLNTTIYTNMFSLEIPCILKGSPPDASISVCESLTFRLDFISRDDILFCAEWRVGKRHRLEVDFKIDAIRGSYRSCIRSYIGSRV